MSNKQEKIEVESFADLFAEQIKIDEKKEGQVVKGTVISIAVSYTHLTLPTKA